MQYDYIYEFERERFIAFWDYQIKKIKLSEPYIYEEAYLIPAIRKDRSMLFGEGGVLDKNYIPVKSSFIIKSKSNKIMFGITSNERIKKQKNIEYLEDEYIYLGYINNHWGHFIVDFCTRLYFAKNNPEKKCIFLVNEKIKNFKLIPQIKRFISLLGINLDKIILISNPIKVKKIIIPMQAYQSEVYFSDEYVEIFSEVVNNIKPTYIKKIEKIYLSRLKINKKLNREIGIEILDKIFKENKYYIIYPEKETLDNQIFLLNNCKEFCTVIGSILHNLMFIKNKKVKIYCINKVYLNNELIRDTCKIMNFEPIFIDAYSCKSPVKYGYGPFIIELNENLKKFLCDNKLKCNNICQNSKKTKYNISKYNLIYYIFYNYLNRKIEIEENCLANKYFSPIHFKNYNQKYSKYEICPLNIFTIMYGVHIFIMLLKKKISSIIKIIRKFF